jgi:hypothetical protein
MSEQAVRKTRGYSFEVDGKQYESPEPVITGAQLREIAQVSVHMRIFAGDHHDHQPDTEIHNSSTIDLAKLAKTKFYTLDPPNMDIY